MNQNGEIPTYWKKRVKLDPARVSSRSEPLKASTPRQEGEKEKTKNSLVEELNLSGTIREVLSSDKVGESVKIFSDHLLIYINSCRYYLSQTKGMQRIGGKVQRSPKNKRKISFENTEQNPRI